MLGEFFVCCKSSGLVNVVLKTLPNRVFVVRDQFLDDVFDFDEFIDIENPRAAVCLGRDGLHSSSLALQKPIHSPLVDVIRIRRKQLQELPNSGMTEFHGATRTDEAVSPRLAR